MIKVVFNCTFKINKKLMCVQYSLYSTDSKPNQLYFIIYIILAALLLG